MLMATGVPVTVVPPDLDDAALTPGGGTPMNWVMGLAYLKATRVKQMILASGQNSAGTILGADTVCVSPRGEILGQPRDQDDARRMLKLLRNAEHRTITGVCLLWLANDDRLLFGDSATVRIGPLTDQQIEHYIATGDWRGKAGAYNLSERIQAGWPIECTPGSDPDTVMGLPMRKLRRMLR
ncbi:MAG: Maf family protein [Phycisphaerales bacterium]|nr:Maf family protein [Phycisphaerales bacterium]